jgi:hypothetical protein
VSDKGRRRSVRAGEAAEELRVHNGNFIPPYYTVVVFRAGHTGLVKKTSIIYTKETP